MSAVLVVAQKREEVYILNSIVFTLLLWSKLDFGTQLTLLDWTVVFVPLWCNNLIGLVCALRRVRRVAAHYDGLEYEWWPQSSKNAFVLGVEALIEELVSTVFKCALIVTPATTPFLVKFSPLWAAVVINAWLYYQRRPHSGLPVKPRYVFALVVALRLDKYNSMEWQLQFAPLWVLLSVTFCGVLLFAFNAAQRRMHEYKRKAFAIAACTTLAVTALCAVALLQLARYLDGAEQQFSLTAFFMVMAQSVALMGLLYFGKYDALDREQQRLRSVAQAAAEVAKEIVLEFIQTPEEVLIRESANLFRKHVAPTSVRPQDFVEAAAPPDDVECLICCMDGASYVILECGHGNFCETCCRELAKRNTCPMCRQSIARIGRLSRKTLMDGDALLVCVDSVALVGDLKLPRGNDGAGPRAGPAPGAPEAGAGEHHSEGEPQHGQPHQGQALGREQAQPSPHVLHYQQHDAVSAQRLLLEPQPHLVVV